MDKDKVLDLAKLARIAISDSEAENLSHEFETILHYVGEIKEAAEESIEKDPSNYPLRNVLREDIVTTESGENTEAILNEAPDREGNFVRVKNIL